MSEIPNVNQIPDQGIERLNDIRGEASVGLLGIIAVRNTARERVQEEHPIWFIAYKQPRTTKEKLALRNRKSKIESREKKIHYAIEAIVKDEMLKAGFDSEFEALSYTARDRITTYQFRSGELDTEAQLQYLEKMLERPFLEQETNTN